MSSSITTEAQVANIALGYIGSRGKLAALTENTTEARSCLTHFAPCRDELLESFPWQFATRRATLALVAGETRTGWTYVYALPSGCLCPLYIYSGARMPAAEERIPFDIEASASGTGTTSTARLLTDQASAELVYTAECANVSLWTPLFVDALAWKLAMRLCLEVAVKPQVAAQMAHGFAQAFAKAGAAQLRHSQPDMVFESEFINGR